MSCLDQAVSNGKGIAEDCQHFLWIWKKSQTESKKNQEKAIEACPREDAEKNAADCVALYDKDLGADNKLIPCMLDYRLNIDNGACDRYNGFCKIFILNFYLEFYYPIYTQKIASLFL